MTMRIYDFRCAEGHITEKFIDSETRKIQCPECDAEAERVISPCNFHLDGCDPGFPGAYDRWAKDHKQRADSEAKKRNS